MCRRPAARGRDTGGGGTQARAAARPANLRTCVNCNCADVGGAAWVRTRRPGVPHEFLHAPDGRLRLEGHRAPAARDEQERERGLRRLRDGLGRRRLFGVVCAFGLGRRCGVAAHGRGGDSAGVGVGRRRLVLARRARACLVDPREARACTSRRRRDVEPLRALGRLRGRGERRG